MNTKIKHIFAALLLVLGLTSVAVEQNVVLAAAGDVYFLPSSAEITKDETITVQVMADMGTNSVYAVETVLNFNPTKLKVTIDTSGSTSDFDQISSPESVSNGEVISKRHSASAQTGTTKLITLRIKALTSGTTTALSVDGDTKLVACNEPCGEDDTEDIFRFGSTGQYTLVAAPEPEPEPEPEPAATVVSNPVQPSNSEPITEPEEPQTAPPAAVSQLDVSPKDEQASSYTLSFSSSLPITGTLTYTNDNGEEKSLSFVNTDKPSFDLTDTDITPGVSYTYVLGATDSNGATIDQSGEFSVPGYQLVVNLIDQLGEPISGANITLGDQTITTNKNGSATFDNLVPGRYETTASLDNVRQTASTLVNNPISKQTLTLTLPEPINPLFIIMPILLIVALAGLIAGIIKGFIHLPKLPSLPKRKPRAKKVPKPIKPKQLPEIPKPQPTPVKPIVQPTKPKKPDDPGIKNPGAGNIVLPDSLSDNQKMIIKTFGDKPISEIEDRLGVRREYNYKPREKSQEIMGTPPPAAQVANESKEDNSFTQENSDQELSYEANQKDTSEQPSTQNNTVDNDLVADEFYQTNTTDTEEPSAENNDQNEDKVHNDYPSQEDNPDSSFVDDQPNGSHESPLVQNEESDNTDLGESALGYTPRSSTYLPRSHGAA